MCCADPVLVIEFAFPGSLGITALGTTTDKGVPRPNLHADANQNARPELCASPRIFLGGRLKLLTVTIMKIAYSSPLSNRQFMRRHAEGRRRGSSVQDTQVKQHKTLQVEFRTFVS